MPRRSRRRREQPPPLRVGGIQRSQTHPDGEWIVRQVAGGDPGRSFVCPGCRQPVSGGSAHIVAWPADAPVGSGEGVESRRHWHSPCWAARLRRR